MVDKSAHPEQLFEYLNGAVDAEAATGIRAHLSVCDDCASVAAAVRLLKEEASGPESPHQDPDQISNPQFEISNLLLSGPYEAHPAVSELASFFYSAPTQETGPDVAAHVARCVSCADAIAQYALAERVSGEYKPGSVSVVPAPQKAWELIRDWEESSFARPKPASEVLGHEMLNRLFSLLDERTQGVGQSEHAVSAARSDRVPVLVVNSSGDMRSVEFFEPVLDETGAGVLKHAEGSQRFDNRAVHALLDYGEKDPVLISELIEADTLRQRHPARAETTARRVDYFIIEERD